jgi:hypothetical protein
MSRIEILAVTFFCGLPHLIEYRTYGARDQHPSMPLPFRAGLCLADGPPGLDARQASTFHSSELDRHPARPRDQ